MSKLDVVGSVTKYWRAPCSPGRRWRVAPQDGLIHLFERFDSGWRSICGDTTLRGRRRPPKKWSMFSDDVCGSCGASHVADMDMHLQRKREGRASADAEQGFIIPAEDVEVALGRGVVRACADDIDTPVSMTELERVRPEDVGPDDDIFLLTGHLDARLNGLHRRKVKPMARIDAAAERVARAERDVIEWARVVSTRVSDQHVNPLSAAIKELDAAINVRAESCDHDNTESVSSPIQGITLYHCMDCDSYFDEPDS